MAQVKYFCNRYSLKTGSCFILVLYLVLGITFFVAEIVSLKGDFTFVPVTVLVFVLLGIVSCVAGLFGIHMTIPQLLTPILCLKIIYLVVSAITFIFFLFQRKFVLSALLDGFADQHFGVFIILFFMGLAFSTYFLIVIYSYYMKQLKEGTPARRSDTES